MTGWRVLPLAAEIELEWFFACADAAVGGLKSPSLEPKEVAGGAVVREASDAQLVAAMRAAAVRRALVGCGAPSVSVLRAWCGPSTYLTQEQRRSLLPLGRLGPVMALTRGLDRWAERETPRAADQMRGPVRALDVLRLRAKTPSSPAARELASVRAEADALLADACRTYVAQLVLSREGSAPPGRFRPRHA